MFITVGTSGDGVKQIQEKLGLPADGKFGPGTEKAVMAFQTSKGLKPDGIVGPQTWDLLMGKKTEKPVVQPPQAVEHTDFPLDRLKGRIPDAVIAQIPVAARKFGISSIERLCHFLAQCAHESGRFTVTEENLKYSANGLRRVFGKYFPGNLAESYAFQPEKIANRVYKNRNGNKLDGDGYRYRGRGYIQLTGYTNYEKFDNLVDDDILANPDLVATKYPLESAAYFFQANKIWNYCDSGSVASVNKVTQLVNGGFNGLEERKKFFTEFYSLLKDH